MMLTLSAVIGAVAAPIPIRIHDRFGPPSRGERKDMHQRVGVVDTLLALVHGFPLMAEPDLCAQVLRAVPGAQGSTRTPAPRNGDAWLACSQLVSARARARRARNRLTLCDRHSIQRCAPTRLDAERSVVM
jgi:hypothetical protein